MRRSRLAAIRQAHRLGENIRLVGPQQARLRDPLGHLPVGRVAEALEHLPALPPVAVDPARLELRGRAPKPVPMIGRVELDQPGVIGGGILPASPTGKISGVRPVNLRIGRGEFESAVGRPLDLILPFDPRGVAAAMNVGQPVAARPGRTSSRLHELGERICGGPAGGKPRRSPFWAL